MFLPKAYWHLNSEMITGISFAIAWIWITFARGCHSLPVDANYLIVVGGSNHESNVDIFDLKTGAWYPGSMPSQGLARYGGALTSDVIYVVGGLGDPQNEFFSYNLSSDSWTTSLPTLVPTDWVDGTLLTYGESLITFGANSTYIGSVFSYDPVQAQWSNVTSLPQRVCDVGAAVVSLNNNPTIVVSGGFDTDASIVTKNAYQSSDGGSTWAPAGSMTVSRSFHQSIGMGTKVYVLGGLNETGSLNSMEIYDITTSVWQSGPPMVAKRTMFGAACDANSRTILVCGGWDGASALAACEVYSMDQDIWTRGRNLRQPSFGFQMFITKTTPFAVSNSLTTTNQSFCSYPDTAFKTPANNQTSCYRGFTVRMDWPHAVVACQMWGGNLVTIESQAENAFVVQLLRSFNETDKAWIGLNSYETFSWDEDDGGLQTVIPSQNSSYPLHCVYIAMATSVQGNWFSQECWSTYSFVCEKSYKFYGEQERITTTTEAVRTTTCSPFGATATCPSSIGQYGMVIPERGSCLVLGGLAGGTTQQSWSAASLQCKEIFGDLVEINDATRLRSVSNLAAIAKTQSKANGAWVGLQNFYRWTNGNKLSYVPNGSTLTSSVGGSCYSFSNTTGDFVGSACGAAGTLLPYICQVNGCPAGMTSVPDCYNTNYICVEENECADGKAVCGVGSIAGTCTDLPHDQGRFRCDCLPGFQQSMTGDAHSSCVDILECQNPATCSQQVQGGLCIEQLGGYLCACKNGYRLTNNTVGSFAALSAQACAEVDECVENPSICQNGGCTNTPGGYTCNCDAGYQLVNGRCVDINECALSLYPCGIPTAEAFCYNMAGFGSDYPNGYVCDCPPGFTFRVDNATCVLINNCEPGGTASCGNDPDARCVNFQSQYYCACSGGKNFDGATQTCMPINLVPLTYGNTGTLALLSGFSRR